MILASDLANPCPHQRHIGIIGERQFTAFEERIDDIGAPGGGVDQLRFGAMLGEEPAGLIGNRFWDFVSPSQAEKARKRTNRTLRTDQASAVIEFCILVGGKEVRLEVVAMPLTFQNVPAVQMVCRDVTLSRRIERQLRQSQRLEAIGRLASGVAHDFNNLLTVILGQAQLMQMGSGDDENTNEAAGEIVHAAEKASVLTRRLLAFSREQKFEPVFLDMNKLIDGLGKLLDRLAGEKTEIEIKPDSGLERMVYA